MIVLVIAAAVAAASGTVTGHIEVTDGRFNPYLATDNCNADFPTGARQTVGFGGTLGIDVPLQEALVIVRARASTPNSVAATRYARTNASGDFSLTWDSGSAPVTEIHLQVVAMRPLIGATTVVSSMPTAEFSVGPGVVIIRVEVKPWSAGNVHFNTLVPSTNVSDAYLTMREVFAMYSDQDVGGGPAGGGTIRGDMAGVGGEPNAAVQGGVAPSPLGFLFGPTIGTESPTTIAHELGHVLAWREFGVPSAVLNPVVDYALALPGCDMGGLAWDPASCEFEKAAFHEGFAMMHAGLWMWLRGAAPPQCTGTRPWYSKASQSFSLEAPGSCNDSNGFGKNKPACSARALWDIVDTPPGDTDPIQTRNLTSVVSALRHYPSGCPACLGDNGCIGEGWPYPDVPQVAYNCGLDVNGNNFRDFRTNYLVEYPTQSGAMTTIMNGNGLGGQDAN